MNVLGVEFDSTNLNYVLLIFTGDQYVIGQSNRFVLTDTRSPASLRSFQDAVTTLLTTTKPDVIGIKSKPEKGQMRAGAAALKMEGILLAAAPCAVDFISGARVNAVPDTDGLKAYHQPAYKTALAASGK